MPTLQSLSIIIITYNRPADVLELLQDIGNQNNYNLLKEVIVLNNCSSEDYLFVKNFTEANPEKKIRFIESKENLGVSGGRNFASTFAQGDILVYLDDDVNIKDKDVLQKISASFSKQFYEKRKLGLVSFKVLYSANMQVQINAFPHKKYHKYKDKKEFLTYYYPGCAHAILKEAWVKTGNYPSDFFYGMEEYDFSYRLINKGYYIKYDSSIVIIHKESPLGRTSKAEKIKMMWVNKSKVAWRYLPKINFYTTAFMWSIFFLKKSGMNIPFFIKGWKEVLSIPPLEKRQTLSDASIKYLEMTEARLWY